MSEYVARDVLADALFEWYVEDTDYIGHAGHLYDLEDGSHRLDVAQLLIEALGRKGYRVVPA